jgi:hypothetical protein
MGSTCLSRLSESDVTVRTRPDVVVFHLGAVRDTQCGFKLFTRPTAALLFPPMNLSRWSFDVELLVLADLTTLSTAPLIASPNIALVVSVALPSRNRPDRRI